MLNPLIQISDKDVLTTVTILAVGAVVTAIILIFMLVGKDNNKRK